MPERDAVICNLGDDYFLIAAGLRREKSGDLTADLMLKNGIVLVADRGVLNTDEGRQTWAAAARRPDGPTAERMAEALKQYVLPDALGRLQEEDRKKPSQADLLVGMVSDLLGDFASDVAETVELFHDPGSIAYATIPIDDHRETWLLHSKGFRQWMARRYHEKHEKTPNTQALVDATSVLAGKAIFDGPEHRVYVRNAEHEGIVYIDLCNERWDVLAIDRNGWRVESSPPVKFRRTRGMLPLPTPVTGGTVTTLRRFINVPSGDGGDGGDASSWILSVAWLIAAFRPRGPYPVLNVLGEQGSAKSTLLRVLRSLIDPNKAPIRTMPRDERDLMIATSNSWCQAFDNLSQLHDWQSDALCRISTGGGLSVRELFTDQDEMIFDAQRPLSLNGIEDVVTRNDLLDRSLLILLQSIPKDQRQPEKYLWREFEEERPRILGAVLDVVATALKNEGAVRLEGYPRMADFVEWIVAAEPALPWQPGAFLEAYENNRLDANDLTLEASPVAQAVESLMNNRTDPWIGSATALLQALEEITDEKFRKQKSWPASGQTLSGILRRLAPNLRAVKIDVTFGYKHGGKKVIRIERLGKEATPGAPPTPGASDRGNSGDASQDTSDTGDDQERHRDEEATPGWEQDSLNWRENAAGGVAGDAGVASLPSHSDEVIRVCLDCQAPLPDDQPGFYCASCGREEPTGGPGDDDWVRR